MEHIILSKIIGENGWQFILVINTVMNKFKSLISMKFRKSESICIICKYFNDKVKGKVFPYSLPSVGPGADPGVQAVSPQVT